MSLFDEYASIMAKYSELYGRDRTVVLMEVGTFLEWYNDDVNSGVNVKKVCDILNVQATRKNKNVAEVSRQNPELGGIPKHALAKYLPLLIDADLTVVLVSQTTPPPNPKREVTEVISKATVMHEDPSSIPLCMRSNDFEQRRKLMASLFLEFSSSQPHAGSLVAFGFTTLDVWTGASTAYSNSSSNGDGVMWDDVRRVLLQSCALELVLCGVDAPASWSLTDFEAAMPSSSCVVHDWLSGRKEYCKRLTQATFQDSVIGCVFKDTGMLTPAEYCGLERMPSAIAAYTCLIDFAYRHNEAIVHRLTPPAVVDPAGRLVLAHNALLQLDVVPKNAKDSRHALVNLLNTAVTPPGRRLFRELLADPVSDAREIERRLQCIERLLDHDSAEEGVRVALAQAYDTERLCRKLSLQRISPKEVGMLIDSVTACLSMQEVIVAVGRVLPGTSEDFGRLFIDLRECVDFIDGALDSVQLARCGSSASEAVATGANLFRRGFCAELDQLFDELADAKRVVEDVARALNTMHSAQLFKVVLDENTSEMAIHVTARRFTTAMQNAAKWPASASDVVVKTVGGNSTQTLRAADLTAEPASAGGGQTTTVRVLHPVLAHASAAGVSAARALSSMLQTRYADLCARVAERYGPCLSRCAAVLAWMDWYASCARNARSLRHTRPTLAAETKSSFVDARGLRHPIIEALNDKVPHVPNDVTIGHNRHQGLLLYGINAAGKSSLMKAVGIAVLMAQTGMYVAADAFTFSPYETLMTRIQSGDNIYAGQSTFMAEMQEVRTMLRRCDERSLMLGDEICAGTESLSATAIVGATLQTLVERHSSFVFATHLHELCDLKCCRGMLSEKVMVAHLAVRVHPEDKTLVYDRRLAKGSGPRLYGLEVCEALGMDGAFMRQASAIRHEMLERPVESSLSLSPSRYSSKLFVSACSICGGAAEDVHHIKHQAWADKDGFIGTEHKNRLSNLVTMCAACHDKTHHNDIHVQGYVQTSRGVKLVAHAREEGDAVVEDANEDDRTRMARDICNMRSFGFSFKKIASVLNSRRPNNERAYFTPHYVQRVHASAAAAAAQR